MTALAFRNFIELCKSLILLKGDSNILEALQVLARGFFMGMEEFITNQEPLPKLAEGQSSDLTGAFLNLVEVEYRRHRDLSFYANTLCKSAKYLSRVIIEATGRSATDWIERCVIMDAKAQLSSTKKRISEISDDLNFASPLFRGAVLPRWASAALTAQHNANGRIVALGALQVVIHPHIHVHLSHVLVGDLSLFQVDEDKALQEIVVENKVDVEVAHVGEDMLLTGHKRKSTPHLNQEILQMRNQAFFQLRFRKVGVMLESEKFRHDGAFQNLQFIRNGLVFRAFQNLRLLKMSLEILCADVTVMRPSQIMHTRVQNF